MTVFSLVLLTYFAVVSGLVYDVIVEPPGIGSTQDRSIGTVRPVVFLPGRVNGQYIIEGLSSGFMFVLGGVGLILMDLALDRNSARSVRISFASFGISAIVIAYAMSMLFIRIKIPGVFFSPFLPVPKIPNHLLFPPQSLLSSSPHRPISPIPRRTPSAPRAIVSASLETAQSVLEAASVLAAIILVHESGHFLAASLQGIHVSKFAIGFGPVLARFVANGVEYSLRAFPLGGFVGFPDDDPVTSVHFNRDGSSAIDSLLR